tara:strand:+ start:1724 stop:1972 length:249 start_codon:yes stop_codon:yes gene_type:complete
MQDIDLRDLEKMRSLLESLEETNYFKEDPTSTVAIESMIGELKDIDMEIDSFFEENDTADPNDVLQAVLDMRTEELKKELEN